MLPFKSKESLSLKGSAGCILFAIMILDRYGLGCNKLKLSDYVIMENCMPLWENGRLIN